MNGSSSLAHSGGSDAATALLKRARFQLMVEATRGSANDGSQSAMTLLSTVIQDPNFDVDDEYSADDYVITPWNPITLHKQGLLRFASPLATSPQEMKVFKLITLASKNQTLARGVKEVEKAISRFPAVDNSANIDLEDPPALLVMAADVSPDEVLMHMQALGEDHNVPSIFVSSRYVLGRIASTKSATAVVLIQKERRAKVESKAVLPGYAARYASAANMLVRLDKQLHYKQPGFVSKWPAPVPHPSWISNEVQDIKEDRQFKTLMEQETLRQAHLDAKDFDEAMKLDSA